MPKAQTTSALKNRIGKNWRLIGQRGKANIFTVGELVTLQVYQIKGYQGIIKTITNQGPMSHGSGYHQRSVQWDSCPAHIRKGKKLQSNGQKLQLLCKI